MTHARARSEFRTVLTTVCLLAAPAPSAVAQTSAPPPLRVGGDVVFSTAIRSRTYDWNFFGDTPNGDYTYQGTQVRFGIARTRKAYDWQIEFEVPFLINLPTTAVQPPPQGQLGLGASYYAANNSSENPASIFLKQGYIRFKGLRRRGSVTEGVLGCVAGRLVGHPLYRAGAMAAEIGWQPSGLPGLKPWIRAGYDYTSGDSNPTDDKHGTFFQVLPTARIYARMPFFNLMNNVDAFGEFIFRPLSRLTIRSDVHALSLADGHDLWYRAAARSSRTRSASTAGRRMATPASRHSMTYRATSPSTRTSP